ALEHGLAPCRGLPGVKDVRVKGAIGVVELDRIDDLEVLRARFVEEGVFVRPFGSIVYLTPAFTIGEDELAKLTRAVTKVGGQRGEHPQPQSRCASRGSNPPHRAMQVVFAGALDPHRRDLALPQRAAARDVDNAVDLRRVAAGAPLGRGRPGAGRVRLAAGAVNLVDDHLLTRADPAPETSRGNRLLMPHEAMPPLLFHPLRHPRSTPPS